MIHQFVCLDGDLCSSSSSSSVGKTNNINNLSDSSTNSTNSNNINYEYMNTNNDNLNMSFRAFLIENNKRFTNNNF